LPKELGRPCKGVAFFFGLGLAARNLGEMMPNKDYAIAMARYNLWQNENLMGAASGLDDAARRLDRGAFFASIEATFAHLLWGDRIWLSRFTGTDAPQATILDSVKMGIDWATFCATRADFDAKILAWAHGVGDAWFLGDLGWFSGAMGREVTKPKALLVLHMFNHQTHHRGQIHAMLTAAGARPGDTNIPFMPARFDTL
jgi:uncharacterized damage-inducible protein DinB